MHTLYETYALWHEVVLKFPKSQRYSLGQTCGQTLLATIERVLEAVTVSDPGRKETCILSASAKLDTLKLLIRLSKDCKCLPDRVYQDIQSKLHQAGKMIGGWLKSLH